MSVAVPKHWQCNTGCSGHECKSYCCLSLTVRNHWNRTFWSEANVGQNDRLDDKNNRFANCSHNLNLDKTIGLEIQLQWHSCQQTMFIVFLPSCWAILLSHWVFFPPLCRSLASWAWHPMNIVFDEWPVAKLMNFQPPFASLMDPQPMVPSILSSVLFWGALFWHTCSQLPKSDSKWMPQTRVLLVTTFLSDEWMTVLLFGGNWPFVLCHHLMPQGHEIMTFLKNGHFWREKLKF